MAEKKLTTSEIIELLETDLTWTDKAGNTLLHHAAATGDKKLIAACLKRKLSSLALNEDHLYPRDIARTWGYDAIVTDLDLAMKSERTENSNITIPYKTINAIHEASEKTGKNILEEIISEGLFLQVIELAKKDPDSLTAQDLLNKCSDGDNIILKIAEQGQLKELMDPTLWSKNVKEAVSAWQTLPELYQEQVDIKTFISQARQIKLKKSTSSLRRRKRPGL